MNKNKFIERIVRKKRKEKRTFKVRNGWTKKKLYKHPYNAQIEGKLKNNEVSFLWHDDALVFFSFVFVSRLNVTINK